MTKNDTHKARINPHGKGFILYVLFMSIVHFSFAERTDTTEVEFASLAYVDSSKSYIERNLYTALAFADSSYALIEQIESETIQAKVLINLGDVYGEMAEMDKALKYYLDAEKLLNGLEEKKPDDVQIKLDEIDIQVNIGILNFRMAKYDKCLSQYEEALSHLEHIIDKAPAKDITERKIRLFNNIAGVYLNKADYDTALSYYQDALELNRNFGNKRYEAFMENNMGICYVGKGEYDLANHHLLKSLSLNKELGNKSGQTQTLNSIGKNQASKGNFERAEEYFEEALQLGKEIGNRKSILVSLESLSMIYDTLGQYKKSLDTFRKFKTLNDSIFSSESQSAMAKLEDAFRRDKEKKTFELEVQREKAERQKVELRNLKIGGVLLLLLLLAIIFLVSMRGKIRTGKLQQQKLKLEHENLELERRTLQESVDYKDRELTANALFLVKNNELISKITEKLLQAKDTFKHENQKIIQDIIFELRSSQDNHLWDEFEAHFTRVHSDFYQKLQEQYPNLTANEKKLCAFLRLNMSTKDISAITYQSVNSITVARSRLRKKLNIEGEDIHLVNFLMDF